MDGRETVICDMCDGIGVRMFDSVNAHTSCRIQSLLLPLTTRRMSCSLFIVDFVFILNAFHTYRRLQQLKKEAC